MGESSFTWQHVVIAFLNFLTVLVTWRMGVQVGRNKPRDRWSENHRDQYRHDQDNHLGIDGEDSC